MDVFITACLDRCRTSISRYAAWLKWVDWAELGSNLWHWSEIKEWICLSIKSRAMSGALLWVCFQSSAVFIKRSQSLKSPMPIETSWTLWQQPPPPGLLLLGTNTYAKSNIKIYFKCEGSEWRKTSLDIWPCSDLDLDLKNKNDMVAICLFLITGGSLVSVPLNKGNK